MNDYEDIIDLPHYEPRHPRMSMKNRAAQFAPFAALSGHDEAIAETARTTDRKIVLSEDEYMELSRNLTFAIDHSVIATITYFIPDKCKEGGRYTSISGRIRRIEEPGRILIMADGIRIPMDSIKSIILK